MAQVPAASSQDLTAMDGVTDFPVNEVVLVPICYFCSVIKL